MECPPFTDYCFAGPAEYDMAASIQRSPRSSRCPGAKMQWIIVDSQLLVTLVTREPWALK